MQKNQEGEEIRSRQRKTHVAKGVREINVKVVTLKTYFYWLLGPFRSANSEKPPKSFFEGIFSRLF